jgi:hypothetical protein
MVADRWRMSRSRLLGATFYKGGISVPHDVEVRGKSGQSYRTKEYGTRREAEDSLRKMTEGAGAFLVSPCGSFTVDRDQVEGMQVRSWGGMSSDHLPPWNPMRGDDD